MSRGCGHNGVVAYAYDADLHCLSCTDKRFGAGEVDLDAKGAIVLTDSEGNPISPIFQWDDVECICGDCGEEL